MASVRYFVHEVDASIAFYTTHFGFALQQQFGPAMAILTHDGLTLWLAGPTASAARPMPDGRKPEPGGWGCNEGKMTNATKYAGVVHTSPDGIIRITIQNLDGALNGKHVFMVPAHTDGITPMTMPDDLGNGVKSWICGSDFALVRNSLPANCRADTLTYANYDYN